MLKPAILYKNQLEHNFKSVIYDKEFFYYVGYPYNFRIPEIRIDDNEYQYAIVGADDKVIGWLAYRINPHTDSIYNFGLYSFDKSNPIIGRDLFNKMNELVKSHHRIEWRMVDGNPVKRHYDKFCLKYDGTIFHLHDTIKDLDGNYCDEYIYEIINKEK